TQAFTKWSITRPPRNFSIILGLVDLPTGGCGRFAQHFAQKPFLTPRVIEKLHRRSLSPLSPTPVCDWWWRRVRRARVAGWHVGKVARWRIGSGIFPRNKLVSYHFMPRNPEWPTAFPRCPSWRRPAILQRNKNHG